MARQHYIVPQGTIENTLTVRLGAGNATSDNYSDKEVGKFVKFTAESTFALTSAGDPIEAAIVSVELATQNGWSIGAVLQEGIMSVTCDGLQATPGTGTIAVGDYVVTGTVVAKGTALSAYPKVCKATNQPGATVTSADNVIANLNAAIAKVTDQVKNSVYAWRVVSLGTAGTGAVGTTAVIQRVQC